MLNLAPRKKLNSWKFNNSNTSSWFIYSVCFLPSSLLPVVNKYSSSTSAACSDSGVAEMDKTPSLASANLVGVRGYQEDEVGKQCGRHLKGVYTGFSGKQRRGSQVPQAGDGGAKERVSWGGRKRCLSWVLSHWCALEVGDVWHRLPGESWTLVTTSIESLLFKPSSNCDCDHDSNSAVNW